MENIKITERERDFLSSILDYFLEQNTRGYVVTRKQYKFRNEEMIKLDGKLK